MKFFLGTASKYKIGSSRDFALYRNCRIATQAAPARQETNYFLKISTIFLAMLIGPQVSGVQLDIESEQQLVIPKLSEGEPAAGKRVRLTPPEYAGTEVFHTLYLPKVWKPDSDPLPVIFEYTGNYHPKSGSTGEVEDAGLGFGLSGGKFIWVSLPYISENHQHNQITWWGDEKATVDYAKVNVPRIIESFNGDPKLVFLCGFSRGAIGVNYLGLHDVEVAGLWTAFISHDHFDGIKEWGNTSWGTPLQKYRAGAAVRLKRVKGRPYLLSQNGDRYGSGAFIRSVLPSVENFTISNIDTSEIFGSFPHRLAKTGHTDRWPLLPSAYRSRTWKWMNHVIDLSK